MEASSKTYVGGAPEKSSEDSTAVGAQLLADELKKQVKFRIVCEKDLPSGYFQKELIVLSELCVHIRMFLGS